VQLGGAHAGSGRSGAQDGEVAGRHFTVVTEKTQVASDGGTFGRIHEASDG